MKIVFVLPGRGRSGGVRATGYIGNKLIERGHEVRILYRRKLHEIKSHLKIAWERLLYSDNADGLSDFKGNKEGFGDLRKTSFDPKEIIIGVGIWGSGQLELLKSIPNPKLQYIHGELIGQPEIMRKTLSLRIPKVGVASYLIPVVEKYGGDGLLGIIHNGVDLREFSPYFDDDRRNGVGTIFSTHPAKDPQTILGTFAELKKKNPDLPIYVFGADRKPAGIDSGKYWRYPSVAKAREIYSKCMVWIVASKAEGFSMPILEAMACGCAVVATDCGGPKDIIVNGENGYLTEVGNVAQIVERTFRLIEDKRLRKDIQNNARETCQEMTWEHSAKKLEGILKSIDGGSGI